MQKMRQRDQLQASFRFFHKKKKKKKKKKKIDNVTASV